MLSPQEAFDDQHCRNDSLHALPEAGMAQPARVAENLATLVSADDRGCTALHLAAKNGQHRVVQILLQHNADVDLPNSSGWTPLHLAALNGYDTVVRILLQQGADPNARAEQHRFRAVPDTPRRETSHVASQ